MSTIGMESDAVYCLLGKVRNYLGRSEFSAMALIAAIEETRGYG